MDFSKNAFVAIGDNDKTENFENVTLGEFDEFKIGMQVRSEEAFNSFKLYALKRGFSIWKAVKWEYNGVIRQWEFVCSNKVIKYHNLDVRMGCCARIRFDVKKWYLECFTL